MIAIKKYKIFVFYQAFLRRICSVNSVAHRMMISLFLVFNGGVSAQEMCPAFSSLSATCRNNHCDIGLGETKQNCPEDCADDNRQVKAYYTQGASCEPTTIYEPRSIAEAQQRVREIVSSGRRIKPAGTSHSATDIICPDANADVIKTKYLTTIGKVEAYEAYANTILVDSGVSVRDLQEYLAERGWSHGFGATGYGGISTGGAIATGAHGSSLLSSSTISSQVVALDIIGPDGALHHYSEGTTGKTQPTLWKALKTHLGLLGLVVRARLKVEPQFNLALEVKYQSEANLLAENGLKSTLDGCDYVFMTWFPGQDEAQYLCGNRTTQKMDSPYAQNQLFTPPIPPIGEALAAPALQYAMCNKSALCNIGSQRLSGYRENPPLVITENGDPLAEVVSRHTRLIGPSHRMITLQPEKFLNNQPSLSQLEYEGAMPLSQAQQALVYLQGIYERDEVCQGLIGTILRFDRADKDLLVSGNHARRALKHGDPMVHLEFVEYWGYGLDESGVRRFVDTPYREIVTYLIENFDYWPHWGKNDEWVFELPALKKRNQSEISQFNQAIAQLDPYGVFQNPFFARAGFSWPKGDKNFASAYFGECSKKDSDKDGLMDCHDPTPTDFSGMWMSVKPLDSVNGNISSGHCRANQNYESILARFEGAVSQRVISGWEYASIDREWNAASFSTSPVWPNNTPVSSAWEAIFRAKFRVPQTGTYCFESDSHTQGDGIVQGRNGCDSIWIDGVKVAETGYGQQVPSRQCLNLNASEQPNLLFYRRHHPTNLNRRYVSKPKWCEGEGCTPSRSFRAQDWIAPSIDN